MIENSPHIPDAGRFTGDRSVLDPYGEITWALVLACSLKQSLIADEGLELDEVLPAAKCAGFRAFNGVR
jgi:hypothetical protein